VFYIFIGIFVEKNMELKVEELRIGNFINRLDRQTKITATASDRHGLGYVSTDIDGAVTINQISPIVLTEEWLLRCPQIKRSNKLSYNLHVYYFEILGVQIDIACKEGSDGIIVDWNRNISSKIQYVHQLQNLFFTLTGNELEIK
jgi:hypothetical protein